MRHVKGNLILYPQRDSNSRAAALKARNWHLFTLSKILLLSAEICCE